MSSVEFAQAMFQATTSRITMEEFEMFVNFVLASTERNFIFDFVVEANSHKARKLSCTRFC
jgi:hypothetical protein